MSVSLIQIALQRSPQHHRESKWDEVLYKQSFYMTKKRQNKIY